MKAKALLSAALAVVSLACAARPTPTVPAPTGAGTVLKIATQSPLSGDRAQLGAAIRNGVRLAVEERGAVLVPLGVRVEVLSFDDRGAAAVGVANAEKIVADADVVMVIGHLTSHVALPASEIYARADLAMISPAGSLPLLTDRGLANVTRVIGRDDGQGAAAAVFAAGELHATSAFIVHDGTAEGRVVAESFSRRGRRAGVSITGEAELRGGETGPVLAAWTAHPADVLFISATFPQAGALIREARARGIDAAILGIDWLDAPELARIAGKAVLDLRYTTVAGPPKFYPGTEGFVRAYTKRFGGEPPSFALQAYDAAALGLDALARAVRAGGSSRPSRRAVGTEIRRTRGYRGLTGTFTFDPKGDPDQATFFVVQVASTNPAQWEQRKLIDTLRLPPPAP